MQIADFEIADLKTGSFSCSEYLCSDFIKWTRDYNGLELVARSRSVANDVSHPFACRKHTGCDCIRLISIPGPRFSWSDGPGTGMHPTPIPSRSEDLRG
ncbi:hypothetical protein BaRGS_00010529 [Batillaria attramentaria]|uniref:Uncharacterized protein n=1 Tax=Batillaria attramentaria TaxID=370345 RepID=A0ABD0LFB2_9CAEN